MKRMAYWMIISSFSKIEKEATTLVIKKRLHLNEMYCCEQLMEAKGVYDVNNKRETILIRCSCCGSYQEIEDLSELSKMFKDEIKKNNKIS